MMETSSPHPSADHESQCANQLMPGAGAGSGAGAVGGAEDLLQAFPLHRACRDGDLPALAVILGDSVVSLCDAVAQDPLFGWTPAHWAAHNGKVDCLEMLMKAGMPCNISSQGPGLTLAHVAALEGQSLCLAWLCQHGVNMNAQDHMGETAAHKAVRCGSVECLHILREHGADFSIQSSIGVTVMELAVQAHQAQCVQYFSAGGDAGHHMTPACLNGASGGRRKRLSVDDGAEAEVTDDTGVAKRARVDSEHAPSPVSPFFQRMPSQPHQHHHHPENTPSTVPSCTGTTGQQAQEINITTGFTNGTASQGIPLRNDIDAELAREFATVVPSCQPIFARRPIHTKHQNAGNGYHSNGDADAMMVDGDDDGVSCRNGHLTAGIDAYNDTWTKVTLSSHHLLHGAMNGTANGTSPTKSGSAVAHGMTNGAVEHNQMVQNSVGYEGQLVESMFNYDVPFGHAY